MKQILGIAGRSRVGKDTLGKVLVDRFNFTRFAFGDILKEVCSEAFDLHIRTFNDDVKDSHFPRGNFVINEIHIGNLIKVLKSYPSISISDSQIELIAKKMVGISLETPRKMLQFVGTDIGRSCIDENIWVNLLIDKVNQCEGNVVVTDCRMENEREELKRLGAKVVLVLRPNIDILYPDSHKAENSLSHFTEYDYVFNNADDVTSFMNYIEDWYSLKFNHE